MKIASVDKEILKVLEGGFYNVPRFQRPYSWSQSNVDEFWNDLKDSFDDEYFIGSMVVYKRGQNSYGIGDGQQRLTTITMMLCIIREIMNHVGLPSLANGIHKLVERADLDDKPQYILQTETSYPFLQEAIQQFPQKTTNLKEGSEEKSLKLAYTHLSKNIEQYIKSKSTLKVLPTTANEDLKKVLTTLRDKILKLKVIFIDLDNEDDAYVVFETLNARGKDLEASDLVKSLVTKLWKAKNKKVDRASDKWKEITSVLGETAKPINVDDFLLHYWISKYKPVSKVKLYGDIKSTIDTDSVETFIEELKSEAEYYRSLHDPNFATWSKQEQKIFKSLKALTIFQVKQPMPLLLAGLSCLRAKTLTIRNAKLLFSVIENFHFITTAILSQSSSGGTSTLYSSYARKFRVAKKADTGKLVRELEKKLKSKIPVSAEFLAAFKDLKYSESHQKQKKLVQYVLEKFDDFGNKFGQPIDYTQMTIEHIAPQQPPSNAGLTSEDIANVGNLLYLSSKVNGSLQNKDFAAKLPILIKYVSSATDHGLSTNSQWDEQCIAARALSMANMAYEKIWKI